mmetsp:Transcript_23102/g.91635  ORF Transcript_23102/g.91635 Transcript_23102/m.91635 type:complete len:205 (+) Transcript_23102:1428-2042(+)
MASARCASASVRNATYASAPWWFGLSASSAPRKGSTETTSGGGASSSPSCCCCCCPLLESRRTSASGSAARTSPAVLGAPRPLTRSAAFSADDDDPPRFRAMRAAHSSHSALEAGYTEILRQPRYRPSLRSAASRSRSVLSRANPSPAALWMRTVCRSVQGVVSASSRNVPTSTWVAIHGKPRNRTANGKSSSSAAAASAVVSG